MQFQIENRENNQDTNRRNSMNEISLPFVTSSVSPPLSKGKIPPPHIKNETCEAVFEYTNRLVMLEGQEPQLWPRLQAICHAVSHFQLPPVMLKTQGFPTPTSTTVRIFSLLAWQSWFVTTNLHHKFLVWVWGGGIFPLNTHCPRFHCPQFRIVRPPAVLDASIKCKSVWVWKSGTCNAVCGF